MRAIVCNDVGDADKLVVAELPDPVAEPGKAAIVTALHSA